MTKSIFPDLQDPDQLEEAIRAEAALFWTVLSDYTHPCFALNHLTEKHWEVWQGSHIRRLRYHTLLTLLDTPKAKTPAIQKFIDRVHSTVGEAARHAVINDVQAWRPIITARFFDKKLLQLWRPDQHMQACFIAGVALLYPKIFGLDVEAAD